MPKIEYPFAALPNQVCRGGHGPINIAVLAALLSHGVSSCAIKTIANEVGCNPKSVRVAIKYWAEKGPNLGVQLTVSERRGATTVIEIKITRMENGTPTENGRGVLPKTAGGPLPKTVAEEEHVKNNIEEDNLVVVKKGDQKTIVAIFDAFLKVNPMQAYGNKTHRRAAEAIIAEYGTEQALKLANFAVSMQGAEFAPVITNPYQLMSKMGNLKVFADRLKRERGVVIVS